MARTIDEIVAGIDEFLAGDGPQVLDVRISLKVVSIYQRRMEGQV